MSRIYGTIFKSLIFPAIQKVSGRDTLAVLERSETTEKLAREEIARIQREKLRRLLVHARDNVAYYRRFFEIADLQPEKMKIPEDFTRIPLLSKEEIRGDPRVLIADNAAGRLREFRTGGSTGEPFPFWKDPHAVAVQLADIRRTRRWWDIDLDSRVARLWGHSAVFAPGTKGRLQKYFRPIHNRIMNRREFSAYDLRPEALERYWRKLNKFSPRMLLGYASALYLLARFLRDRGIDARSLSLDLIVSTSETLPESRRRLIEEVFGCPVALRYGAVETGELAFECPRGTLHVLDDHIYLEVVRTEETNHLPDDYGEVVVTSLENFAAPLIRYRLYDIARLGEEECACGRKLSVLKGIEGRLHDLIRTPDGGYVHGEIFTHLLDQIEGVKKFQVTQDSPEKLTVTLVGPSLPSRRERAVKDSLRRHLSERTEIRIEYAREIPQERAGKFRWIKSQV